MGIRRKPKAALVAVYILQVAPKEEKWCAGRDLGYCGLGTSGAKPRKHENGCAGLRNWASLESTNRSSRYASLANFMLTTKARHKRHKLEAKARVQMWNWSCKKPSNDSPNISMTWLYVKLSAETYFAD